MNKNNSKGFTLIEVIASMTILVMALTMALAGYLLLLKNTNQGDIQHQLDVDVQTAIEHLKKDLRLSSMDEIYGYPEGTPPYEAISFPVAKVDPQTGRLTRDPSTKEIIWDETVIYHIVSGAPDKLTRTTFSPRDNSIGDSGRQDQLDYVVENDGAAGADNAGNASSKTIFENLLNWGLDPRTGLFSAYADTPNLEVISMGYALLNADTNSFTFTVKGNQGNGYKIGIDQILGSPSYRYQEAELQATTYSGSSAPFNNPRSSYGNRKELLFDANAIGDSITVTVNNDRWDLTDFGNLAGGGFSSTDKTIVKTDYVNNEIILTLAGKGVAWNTEDQAGDFMGYTLSTNLTGTTVQIMQKGSSLDDNNRGHIQGMGQRSFLTFQASTNSNLKIDNVWFGESASSNSIAWAFDGNEEQVSFKDTGTQKYDTIIPNGNSRNSEWIDIPVDPNKNYIVSFTITSAASLQAWRDNNSLAAGSAFTTRISNTNGTSFVSKNFIPALKSITTTYVDEGVYTSDIMDTKLDAPTYNFLGWDSDLPSNTTMTFKVRFGDLPDLSDAKDFTDGTLSTVFGAGSSSSQHFISGNGRYVQFQAIMESDSATNLESPTLKRVYIDWDGERRMVNIMGKFSKGPDYGDFELSVNGKPLQSALIINLEIYKDAPAMNHQTRRISSSIKAEISPRNSSL